MTTDFAKRIVKWYQKHGRHDLPWQKRVTAYRVWVSEIMLQQTQVTTVIPYYQRFMQRFPSLKSLAIAEQDEVLHHWSGLGYYARARNLHKTAQIVAEQHAGCFPKTIEALCELPGIGRSTAGAIASFAYQQPTPILDGNVKRVLARHFAVDGWPGNSAVLKALWALTENYTPKNKTHHYNQAMMDIGATLCTRTKPKCSACPVHASCQAFSLNRQTDFPAKKPKKARPTKETYLFIFIDPKERILLTKRPPSGIWGGLWSFPEYPMETDLSEFNVAHELEKYSHQFSHFQLDIYPIVIKETRAPSLLMESEQQFWYKPNSSLPGGIATPVKNLLEQLCPV